MAIQCRRGIWENFTPWKLLSGEFAVVLSGDPNASSGRSVYICFEPGIVKRITTYEDFELELESATADVQAAFTAEIQAAISNAIAATNAANAAQQAAETAALAAQQAAEAAGAYVLGDISGKTVDFASAAARENIASGESMAVLMGKVAKYQADFDDLPELSVLGSEEGYSGLGSVSGLADTDSAVVDIAGTPKKITWANIWDKIAASIVDKLAANDLLTTVAGRLLDARQGKVLKDEIDELNTKSVTDIPTTVGSATLYRCGHMRIMNLKNFSASEASKLTLGASDRPAKQMDFTDVYYSGGTFQAAVTRINADGTITFFNNAGATSTSITGIYACLVWNV